MNITITGKNFTLTDGVKTAVEEKTKKLNKFVGEDADLEVKLGAKGKNIEKYAVELTLRFDKNVVRTEVFGTDMYKTIADAVDVAVGRVKKLKGKLKKKAGEESIRDVVVEEIEVEDELLNLDGEPSRCKTITPSVMTSDEAIIEMEYTDHDFYVFKNAKNNDVPSIVYKRKDGGYGMISIL